MNLTTSVFWRLQTREMVLTAPRINLEQMRTVSSLHLLLGNGPSTFFSPTFQSFNTAKNASILGKMPSLNGICWKSHSRITFKLSKWPYFKAFFLSVSNCFYIYFKKSQKNQQQNKLNAVAAVSFFLALAPRPGKYLRNICVICWIESFSVDSAIHPFYNLAQLIEGRLALNLGLNWTPFPFSFVQKYFLR